MFSHLKKLILDSVGKRRARRPDRMPRFRGQLEQLESRTVLSATMGPMAVEFVAIDFDAHSITVISVWESRPAPAPQLALNSFNQFGDAPWENPPSYAHFADRGPGPIGGTYWRPPLGLAAGNHASDPTTGEVTSNAPVIGEDQLPGSHPKDQPLGIQSNNQNVTNNFVNRTVETLGLNAPTFPRWNDATGAESYFSSLVNSTGSAESTTSLQRSSLETQDTVFDAYSADSLLLASNVDSKHDLRIDGELDDKRDAHDEKFGVGDDPDDSLVEKDATASLDALQRERAEVDAVLAELHEIKLNRESHRSESASSDQTPHRTAGEASDRELFNDAQRMAAQPANQDADGGMVFLRPSGDANSSAYDLTAVYVSGLAGNAALPLGVEASVGMYQAIDVGTSELRPASRETLPLAQPSGTARPSVSAENAPAKKSEQPS